jgi:hypothetical protein
LGILTGSGAIKFVKKLKALRALKIKEALQAGKKAAAARVASLAGKTLDEVERILKGHGFKFKSRTSGGYRKYVHSDGSEIWIRPNGGVKRVGPKRTGPGGKRYGDRYGPDGEEIPYDPGANTHDTGECLSD